MRSVTPDMPGFSVDQAAKLAGTDATVLRMWMIRYRWPNPATLPNGFRRFTRAEVEDLKRVVILHRSGIALRKLIVGGMPQWPTTRAHPDFARLKAHGIREGRHSAEDARYLRLIEGAIVGRAAGILQALLIEVSCLVHPSRRAAIAWTPALLGLAAWDKCGRVLPGADDIRQFIRDQLGSDAMAALLESIANSETTT